MIKTNKRSLRLFYVLRKVNGDVGYTIVAPGLKGLISLSGTASLAVKVSALARSSAARTYKPFRYGSTRATGDWPRVGA